MKRIITVTALFFSFCLLGTFAGATFAMLCMDLTQFVIGVKLSLFSSEFFLKGIYLAFPLSAIMTLLMLVMYQIRHPTYSTTALISYIALNLLTWLVLIPLMLLLSMRTDIRPPSAAPSVSPGYFRTEDDLVYYWSKFSYDGKGEGLYIDVYGLKGRPGVVYPLQDADKPEQKTPANFADSLVLSAIHMPRCVSIPLTAYLYLVYHARDALSRSYVNWLMFASLGIALASVYAVGWLSSWRLLNAFIVIIVGIGIALLNYALYASSLVKPLTAIWLRALGSFGTHFPLVVCANIVISLILVGTGIFRHVSRIANEELVP